jgi:hypothetical protein
VPTAAAVTIPRTIHETRADLGADFESEAESSNAPAGRISTRTKPHRHVSTRLGTFRAQSGQVQVTPCLSAVCGVDLKVGTRSGEGGVPNGQFGGSLPFRAKYSRKSGAQPGWCLR